MMRHLFSLITAAWMASLLVIVWAITGRAMEDRGPRSCPRRGCRREPAGQGCNHAPACDGSRAGQFTPPVKPMRD